MSAFNDVVGIAGPYNLPYSEGCYAYVQSGANFLLTLLCIFNYLTLSFN